MRKSSQDAVDMSSDHASIGGFSNYASLLVASPNNNDNSMPLRDDNDFSSLLDSTGRDFRPASEMKIKEESSGDSRKREKQERRLSKKLQKQNKV